MEERLTWTVPEAAALLGISPGAYYIGIARNELPYLRLTARRLVVPKKAIEALLSKTGPAKGAA